jgi:hypothetical protein
MINILTNKLPESKNRDIIWKNDKREIYYKFCQSIDKKQETAEHVPKPTNIPKVLNVIPVLTNRLPAIIPDSPVQPVAIQDIPRVTDVQVDSPAVHKLLSIVNKATTKKEKQTCTQKKGNRNNDKNSPMKIILEESQTYDTYRDDVRDKIIKFISTKEFGKVFGITKSAEIMSGIANDRFNKSTVLFISFLFDKCVIYNDKNIIYNKNNGIIEI